MALAETTRGTWRLDEAIERHWRLKGLDDAFRREWLDQGATEYSPLHDEQALPTPPGPYCCYEKMEPEVVASMSGLHGGEERQIVRWTFRFNIHAQDKSGPPAESAKEVAVRLAKQVAEVFDPHNVGIEIDGSAHVVTERGPDWHAKEGDRECVWTMEYRWLVDAKVKISAYDAEEESSASSASSLSSSSSLLSTLSSQSSVSSSSSQSVTVEEDDDVLDFEDIGGVYDSSGVAVANTAALKTYLATRVNDLVALRFGGPKDYGNKRQPGVAYLDLSGGAIAINVGGAGNISHLLLEGPSHIIGTGAASATTPIFHITRTFGTMPRAILRNFAFTSNGSVLKLSHGGSGLVLEDITIVNFTGVGVIDHEAWTEVDAETFSYGIWLDDADGARLQNVQIREGSGHGMVGTRLHAGDVQVRVQHCDGAGFKLQECNTTRAYWWAEHCEGYGLMVRDTGVNRRTGGVKVANDGGPNEWLTWLEGCNGRNTIYNALGHRFSQFRMDNCARIKMTGHSGWRTNMARLDRFSRLRNEFVDDYYLDPSVTPDLELVTDNLVNANIVLPADALGNASITNWGTVWPDAADRPTAVVVGAGTASDPERIRVTWPAWSFDEAVGTSSAYWRPFNNISLSSPASFYFTAQIKSVDGASAYCLGRESVSVTNRQLATMGNFMIAPVAGAITPFALWDSASRWLGGSFDVEDTRSDIQPEFNAWVDGMQDLENDAPQNAQIVIDIYQMRLYRMV